MGSAIQLTTSLSKSKSNCSAVSWLCNLIFSFLLTCIREGSFMHWQTQCMVASRSGFQSTQLRLPPAADGSFWVFLADLLVFLCSELRCLFSPDFYVSEELLKLQIYVYIFTCKNTFFSAMEALKQQQQYLLQHHLPLNFLSLCTLAWELQTRNNF